MVKVFTRINCVYCPNFKRWLDKKGVSYQELDATEHGIATVPAIKIGDDLILGMNLWAVSRSLEAHNIIQTS